MTGVQLRPVASYVLQPGLSHQHRDFGTQRYTDHCIFAWNTFLKDSEFFTYMILATHPTMVYYHYCCKWVMAETQWLAEGSLVTLWLKINWILLGFLQPQLCLVTKCNKHLSATG